MRTFRQQKARRLFHIYFDGSWLTGGSFVLMAFAANISPIIVALIKETNYSDIWGVAYSTFRIRETYGKDI